MKRNNKWQLLVALMTVLIIFHACKKKDLESQPINPTIKNYFSYKPGTYWIYIDSLTGLEDSFAITSNNTLQETDISGKKYDKEVAEVTRYNNGISLQSCSWQLSSGDAATFVFGMGHRIDFKYPFLRDTSQFVGGITSISSNLASHAIRDITYDSLHQVFTASGSNMQPFRDNFFINKNIGVVKMSIGEADSIAQYVFELVRYKIVH